jgi:hypothetical protein
MSGLRDGMLCPDKEHNTAADFEAKIFGKPNTALSRMLKLPEGSRVKVLRYNKNLVLFQILIMEGLEDEYFKYLYWAKKDEFMVATMTFGELACVLKAE